MTTFRPVGRPFKIRVRLRRGEGEGLKAKMFRIHNGEEVPVDLEDDSLTFEGDTATFRWETTDALEDTQLMEDFLFRVYDSDENPTTHRKHVLVFRRSVEVHAVDAEGAALPGATCRLTVHVDPEFQADFASEPKFAYDKGYEKDHTGKPLGDHDDERVYLRRTDGEGKVVFNNLPPGHVEVAWDKPYALTVGDGGGWQVEGEFTLEGPKRKAQLELLPLVHYIWWGNPGNDDYAADASETPNAVAGLGRMCVHYWRNCSESVFGSQAAKGEEFVEGPAGDWNGNAALIDAIEVHEITSTGDPRTEGNKGAAAILNDTSHSGIPMPIHDSFRGRGRAINDVVATMSRYNMRSAVKDFISLMVLYRHGGWYFDTTTANVSDPAGDLLGKLRPCPGPYTDDIAAEDEIKFVRTRTGGNTTLHLTDRAQDMTKMLGNLDANLIPGVVETENVDVWGIYSPPRHPAVLTMIDSYLERAQNMGLSTYGTEGKTPAQVRNHRYLLQDPALGEEEAVKGERNKIIGNLIICSVLEGLVKYRQLKGLGADAVTIATREPTEAESNTHHVAAVSDALGIGKRHAGNWRQG